MLDARLLWIAQQVRSQVFFIDIGSDHARLPIYLVQNGIVAQAIASDVAQGAVEQGRTHVTEYGLEAHIEVRLGNGLERIDLPCEADIAICGMGSDSICAIIDAKPEVKQSGIRLLLQAMTDTPVLRRYLAENGFDIETEACVFADGRYYQCMVAAFTGRFCSLSLAEAELGVVNIEQRSKTFLDYVRKRKQRLEKWLPIKQRAGEDTVEQEALLAIYNEVLQR